MSDKAKQVQVWQPHREKKLFNPVRALVAERRKPENAPIRRWLNLGDKALKETFQDNSFVSAA